MTTEEERARLEATLAVGLEAVDGVAAALLFGSWATGRARAESDIDLAVLFDRTPPAEGRLARIREVVTALAEHVDSARLHVVVLDDAPPALAFQVMKHGREIVCRDRTRLHRFRVRVYREHGDREPVERFFREATKARAARLGARG